MIRTDKKMATDMVKTLNARTRKSGLARHLTRKLARKLTYVLTGSFLSLAALGVAEAQAQAQNLFAPVKKINDRVITAYELSQRMAFLTLLRAPGNTRELAMEQLTKAALQGQAADLAGIKPSAEDILAGMEEFAGRFNMSVEQFNKVIAQNGVAPETFRDFVSGGIAWRQVVRARWAGRIIITEDDIDRQLSLTRPGTGVRVLLSEIILPATSPAQLQSANARASQLGDITTLGAFATAARRYSVAPSRGRSGRLNWMDISNLPPAVAAQILPLEPGSVTDPIPVKNGLAVFQLRAIEETAAPAPKDVTVDYATLMLPGGRSPATLTEAAKLRGQVDTCDDLYGIFKEATPQQLQRQSVAIGQIPTRIGLELAKLDEGEASTALTSSSGENLMFLMLCSRTRDLPEDVSRDDIKLQLQNQRLQSFAQGYLDELKAAAYIEDYSGQ